MKKVIWNGLTVTEDGKFFDKDGREVFKAAPMILLSKKPFKYRKKERAIYEAFHNYSLTRKEIIKFKDGDNTNYRVSNLECISLKEYKDSMGYNEKLKKVSIEDQKEIIRIYKKAQKDEVFRRENKVSLRNLAALYGCSLSTVQKIIGGIY